MKIKIIITGVVQGLVSAAMLLAGSSKLMTPYQDLVTQMPWAADFSPNTVIVIGVLEVLGVVGMNLPYVLKKYKNLVPLAAAGLALTMLGAVVVHVLRSEQFIPPLVLFVMAGYVTYARADLFKNKQS